MVGAQPGNEEGGPDTSCNEHSMCGAKSQRNRGDLLGLVWQAISKLRCPHKINLDSATSLSNAWLLCEWTCHWQAHNVDNKEQHEFSNQVRRNELREPESIHGPLVRLEDLQMVVSLYQPAPGDRHDGARGQCSRICGPVSIEVCVALQKGGAGLWWGGEGGGCVGRSVWEGTGR